MFRLLAILLFILIVPTMQAQETDITFQVKGLHTPIAVIGYFQGGKAYRLDSLRVDVNSGKFRFQKSGLRPGVYFCSSERGKLFDFILAETSDTFSIGADLARLDSVWSVDSPENEAYFRFEQSRKTLEGKIEAKKTMRRMVAQASKNDAESLKPVDQELETLIRQTDSLALGFVAQYPGHLFAKMLHSVRPPEPPSNLKASLKNGKANPAFTRWQRQHYWDNTDFRNEAYLNNTFWQAYFDNFFSQYVAIQPDSLITAIDEVLAKTPKGGAFFRFITQRIAQYYEQNEAPGADRIFVHMVDKYMKKDETPWLDQATLVRLAYKADVNRSNLTGSLAVNFTMPDETGRMVELYNIEAPFTMLVFYSPLCSHCMEVMPNIYQTYLDYQGKGLAAVALNTDQESAYWKKFVTQQGWIWYDVDDKSKMEQLEKQYNAFNLPVIYLLDKDKRILAKKLKPTELGALLGAYFERK